MDDHYSILGVLPDADPVVIVAVYRALCKKYHPDRWPGGAEEAHAKMVQINLAYGVLSDSEKRADYDRIHAASARGSFEAQDRADTGLDDSMYGFERQWSLAVSVHPDLESLRRNLEVISRTLSCSYVACLLETKRFDDRANIARQLEQDFLRRFFGTSPPILAFARNLIMSGQRAAAKRLNEIVNVLGASVSPDVAIDRVIREFPEAGSFGGSCHSSKLIPLIDKVLKSGGLKDCIELSEAWGFEVKVRAGGWFAEDTVVVTSSVGKTTVHPNKYSFIAWVQSNARRLEAQL